MVSGTCMWPGGLVSLPGGHKLTCSGLAAQTWCGVCSRARNNDRGNAMVDWNNGHGGCLGFKAAGLPVRVCTSHGRDAWNEAGFSKDNASWVSFATDLGVTLPTSPPAPRAKKRRTRPPQPPPPPPDPQVGGPQLMPDEEWTEPGHADALVMNDMLFVTANPRQRLPYKGMLSTAYHHAQAGGRTRLGLHLAAANGSAWGWQSDEPVPIDCSEPTVLSFSLGLGLVGIVGDTPLSEYRVTATLVAPAGPGRRPQQLCDGVAVVVIRAHRPGPGTVPAAIACSVHDAAQDDLGSLFQAPVGSAASGGSTSGGTTTTGGGGASAPAEQSGSQPTNNAVQMRLEAVLGRLEGLNDLYTALAQGRPQLYSGDRLPAWDLVQCTGRFRAIHLAIRVGSAKCVRRLVEELHADTTRACVEGTPLQMARDYYAATRMPAFAECIGILEAASQQANRRRHGVPVPDVVMGTRRLEEAAQQADAPQRVVHETGDAAPTRRFDVTVLRWLPVSHPLQRVCTDVLCMCCNCFGGGLPAMTPLADPMPDVCVVECAERAHGGDD